MIRPLLALLLFPLATYGADTVRLTGREAEAVQLATQVFKSKQGSKDQEGHPVYGDLRHYTLQIERHGRNLEVIFVPEEPPLKPNEAGTGGSTIYGWEVHYIIALDQMKILEEHYAR